VPARSKARKRALDILFAAELRDASPLQVLREQAAAEGAPFAGYAADLVRGVEQHRPEIDSLLSRHAQGWTLDRMPAVDRNILRIGAYELLWAPGVPEAVAINEAVLLAQDLSTEASAGFVNGLLARLLELKPELLAGAAADPDAPPGQQPEAGPDDPDAQQPGG
jgi:N utilization substance protein B